MLVEVGVEAVVEEVEERFPGSIGGSDLKCSYVHDLGKHADAYSLCGSIGVQHRLQLALSGSIRYAGEVGQGECAIRKANAGGPRLIETQRPYLTIEITQGTHFE